MDTTRLIVLVVLTAAAVGVALILQRRRPDPPSAPSYRAPSQLDRDDFGSPPEPVLAVLFASTKCSTCPTVWRDLVPMAGERLGVVRVDVEDDPTVHGRYRIDGVPTTVFVDAEGVVGQAFFGPVSPEELAEAARAMGGLTSSE